MTPGDEFFISNEQQQKSMIDNMSKFLKDRIIMTNFSFASGSNMAQ